MLDERRRVGTGGSPVGCVPAARRLVKMDTSQGLQHTLRFGDEPSPTSKGKPAAVVGWKRSEART